MGTMYEGRVGERSGSRFGASIQFENDGEIAEVSPIGMVEAQEAAAAAPRRVFITESSDETKNILADERWRGPVA